MFATGYFTIERNIVGRDTTEIERSLGFRPGRLNAGVRILELLQSPTLDQFELGGSTRYSNRAGLDQTRLAPLRIPFGWTNQRLVKVDPLTPHTREEIYPSALGVDAAEQWLLKPHVRIAAREICRLAKGDRYWGHRK